MKVKRVKYTAPLEFEILHEDNGSRVGELRLPHHTLRTPIFMPVGTQGTVKGLLPEQLLEMDVGIILGNTYHLGHRPGGEVVARQGGLHKYEQWPRNILTDSGGFQMVSLLKLAKITEEGVEFVSPHDQTKMVLTPEHSMHLQNQIGADIMMALDAVISIQSTPSDFAPMMERTVRWLDRCIAAHERKSEQALYGIVQGGVDLALRKRCIDLLAARDLPGYAIGGLSGGESKDDFWRVVHFCCGEEGLPRGKPRYVMGVGYPVDIIICCVLGADQFDCVYPTRTARFGTALTSRGNVAVHKRVMATQYVPLDDQCSCKVCARYTRAFLHRVSKRALGCKLLTYHNIHYLMRLLDGFRAAVASKRVSEFIKAFFAGYYPDRTIPQWCLDALQAKGIHLGD